MDIMEGFYTSMLPEAGEAWSVEKMVWQREAGQQSVWGVPDYFGHSLAGAAKVAWQVTSLPFSLRSRQNLQ
jgi:hypothetical protein